MAPQLANEELLLILSSASLPPPRLDEDGYKQWRAFLLRCRRVNKQWHRVSDRLRFEHLQLLFDERSTEAEHIVRGGKNGVGRYLRHIRAEGGRTGDLQKILEVAKQVREVVGGEEDGDEPCELDISVFDGCKELQRLDLNLVYLGAPFSPLPQLTTLVLSGILTSPNTLSAILRPTITPSLRAAALHSISLPEDDDAYDEKAPIHPVLPEILSCPDLNLDRLDLLQLGGGCGGMGFIEAPETLFASGLPIVVSYNVVSEKTPQMTKTGHGPSKPRRRVYPDYDPSCHAPPWLDIEPVADKLPPHLHINLEPLSFHSLGTDSRLETLTRLVASFPPGTPCPLQTLFFPTIPPEELKAEQNALIAQLLDVCHDRGVKVELVAMGPGDRASLNEDVWRWGREQRRRAGPAVGTK